jgi:hypothetical protein
MVPPNGTGAWRETCAEQAQRDGHNSATTTGSAGSLVPPDELLVLVVAGGVGLNSLGMGERCRFADLARADDSTPPPVGPRDRPPARRVTDIAEECA